MMNNANGGGSAAQRLSSVCKFAVASCAAHAVIIVLSFVRILTYDDDIDTPMDTIR